jgi:ribosomal protein S18 acetylase RimI-like enzyme
MNTTEYEIVRLQPGRSLPFHLFLLADETVEAIEKYIYNSDVYIVNQKDGKGTIAAFALYKISNAELEIKNIAISESLQGLGIGSSVINEIKKIAIANHYKRIIVGTPDNSSRLIHFYEKNGFTKYAMQKDFFIKNYSDPIIENGVTLRNMVMLKLDLEGAI